MGSAIKRLFFTIREQRVLDITKTYYLFLGIPVIVRVQNQTMIKHKLFNIITISRKKRAVKNTRGEEFQNTVNLHTIESAYTRDEPEPQVIDIIVPVYNGLEYLENLFQSIYKNTDIEYRLIVVNDASPDKNVQTYLESLKDQFGEALVLVQNSTNLGFVKSVNKGLEISQNHVVLLNTDVILPKNWASRLLKPIFVNRLVASVTPFSNAATMFSLPNIMEDNEFTGDLEAVNANVSRLKAIPYEHLSVPSGVGFCMAMNKEAIAAIGYFDEIFEKGFGEENDWCQRAVKKGFFNTIAPDVFVWHKHGGSFPSEERKSLIRKHLLIIQERYPAFFDDIQGACKNEVFYSMRFYAEILYWQAMVPNTHVIFESTEYPQRGICAHNNNILFIKIEYVAARQVFYKVTYYHKNSSSCIQLRANELPAFLRILRCSVICINGFAEYVHHPVLSREIKNLKEVNHSCVRFVGANVQNLTNYSKTVWEDFLTDYMDEISSESDGLHPPENGEIKT